MTCTKHGGNDSGSIICRYCDLETIERASPPERKAMNTNEFSPATPAQNLRVLLALHRDTFSVAEQREVEEAASLIQQMAGELEYRDKVKGTFCDSCVHWEQHAYEQNKRAVTAESQLADQRAKLAATPAAMKIEFGDGDIYVRIISVIKALA